MYPGTAFRMQFTSNHDENTWNGTVQERLGDAAETFAALSFVIPGMPLIYSGQEAGLNKRLEFFEKDTIDWKESGFSELYMKLCRLKENNKALWNGEKGGELNYKSFRLLGEPKVVLPENLFAFERESEGQKIFAVFNLSGEKYEDVNLALFNLDKDYKELFSNESLQKSVNFKPWSYKIFYIN
jgi:glycosidase